MRKTIPHKFTWTLDSIFGSDDATWKGFPDPDKPELKTHHSVHIRVYVESSQIQGSVQPFQIDVDTLKKDFKSKEVYGALAGAMKLAEISGTGSAEIRAASADKARCRIRNTFFFTSMDPIS